VVGHAALAIHMLSRLGRKPDRLRTSLDGGESVAAGKNWRPQ